MAVWALHITDLFTDVSVSHGPALTVQAGAGAGQTHGGHVALDDRALQPDPDVDALRIMFLVVSCLLSEEARSL